MVRNKKKMTFSDFEEHVIFWWTDQVELERDAVEELENDKSFCQQEREFVFAAMADRLVYLLELIEPCIHDEQQLVDWAKDFIAQWQVDDSDNEN